MSRKKPGERKSAVKKEKISESFEAELAEKMHTLPSLGLAALAPDRTVLLIVDMINGFTRMGALRSDRVAGIIPEVAALSEACEKLGIARLAFADAHREDSPEFGAYPVHCLAGSEESEVVDEIKKAGGYVLIPKNSTNAFHEPAFRRWLDAHPQVDTFLIAGCCTDICVFQLATALKTWFNAQNRASRVIVPRSAVETYDLPGHPAEAAGLFALYGMQTNGVELVSAAG